MSTTPPQPENVEVTTIDLRRSWGWVLVLGIAFLIGGLVTLVWPSVTVYALVFVLGILLLFAGASEVGWAIAERHTDGWKIILARGIIDVITGIIVLAWPDITVLALALVLAAWLFIYGGMTLWYAYRHRDDRPHTGHFLIKGSLAIVAGVITVVWPSITVLVIAIVIGVSLIIYGGTMIALALNLRRARTA